MSAGRVKTFWDEFVTATGTAGTYEAWAFGDEGNPDLADQLAQLVLHGPKRATTDLYDLIRREGEQLPEVGAHNVVLDARGDPVCIILTTSVEVARFGDVDEEFAFIEGEGDRSLEYWRRAHIEYWASIGEAIDDDTRVVLERFELVWPLPPTVS